MHTFGAIPFKSLAPTFLFISLKPLIYQAFGVIQPAPITNYELSITNYFQVPVIYWEYYLFLASTEFQLKLV
jgi:hypothetical protein